jgi:parvulin-like peptidyl-prolyl isomerase
LTRKERERRRQRQIITVSGIALGLSVLAILAGVLYEQVWLPSRPVAQVGDTTLTRGDYWRERRAEIARTMGQSLYLATFGEQFAQQFLGQISQLDVEVPQIRSLPVNDATVDEWADLQIIQQRAASAFGLQASDAEIAQELVGNYGDAFAPTTPLTPTVGTLPTLPPTSETPAEGTPDATTEAGTPQATVEGTPQATVEGTPAATATPAGPTATPSPSATPAPTEIPSPTPQADEALRRQDEVVNRMFSDYQAEILRVDPQRRPQLTAEDFRRGLQDQFRRQVLVRKVQEQLVPDEGFTPSTEPSNIDARHILVKVTVPMTATEQEREAAYAARLPEAEALLEQALSSDDFETLALGNSEDYNTRDLGGTLPGFDPTGATQSGTQIDPAIVEAVAGLEEGQVAPELVRTSFGWHIVQLASRTVDTRETQLQQARTEAFDTWLAEQRAELSVERFPAVSPTPVELPTGTPAPLPTVELGGNPSPTPLPEPTPLGTPVPVTVEPVPTATP